MPTIKYGDRFADLRYDPIDLELVPQEIQGADGIPDPDDPNGEFHEVVLIKGTNGKYGFSPNEMPYRDLALVDSGIVVYEVDAANVAIGSPLTQVRPAVGTQPGLTEYAVDFNNAFPYLNTGRFIFNPANVGKYYRIHRYFGIGGLNSVANTRAIEEAVLNSKLSRDGSLPMTGALNMGGYAISSLLESATAGHGVSNARLETRLSGIISNTGFSEDAAYVAGTGKIVTLPSSGVWFFIIMGASQISSVVDGVEISGDRTTFMGITSGSQIEFNLANDRTISTRAIRLS